METVSGHNGPVVTNPTVSELEHFSSASQEDDGDDTDFSSSPLGKADSVRRRLKNTLHSKGAWHKVARIEDLCHTHVSHKWVYHLEACAVSVLTPHDYITNVQKRLGNGTRTGFGHCRMCGSFLDQQLEKGEPLTQPRLEGDPVQAAFERKLTAGKIPDLIVLLSGQMGDHTLPSLEHCSMQTSHPAATAKRCRRNRVSTDGNTKSRWLFFAREQP